MSMNRSVRKYQITITKINTGESETHMLYAMGNGSAIKSIERLYDSSEYRIDSLTEVLSIVKIAIEQICPN